MDVMMTAAMLSILAAGIPQVAPGPTPVLPSPIGRPAQAGATPGGMMDVPILMYHYISLNQHPSTDPARTALSVAPDTLTTELLFLRGAGYTTVSLDDVAAALDGTAQLPARPVALTFDDGYEDFYLNAFPLLRALGIKATIYIITGKVGQPGYMTWSQLRELAQSGLITIGAHTRTHASLARLPLLRAWDEIAGSKTDLTAHLGLDVRHFAYPSGSYSALTVAIVRAAGFRTAVTTNKGSYQDDADRLTLRRLRVKDGPIQRFADEVAGRMPLARAAPAAAVLARAPALH